MSASLAQPAASRSPTLELLSLALPIILMTVSRMLMGFIDVVMVARLGTDALAAISPASMFVFMLGCLGLGVANAVQTFVAQCDGRGEPRQAGGYAWQCFYIAALFAILTLPFALTAEQWYAWIARAGGHTPQVTALEIDYVRICLWSIAPAILAIGMNSFFTGVQRPWITFVATLVSLGTNVFGNWLLIFGHWGLPALGIAGAAYATVIAWTVRAVVMIAAMLLPSFDRRYGTRHSYAFSWPMMRGLIRIGLPTSLQWLFDLGSWSAFMILIIPPFGPAAMAAGNAVMQLMHLSFMPAIGIGIALCSQVGFEIGAGRPDRAFVRAAVAFRLTGTYMGLAGVGLLLLPEQLVGLFSQEADVLDLGRLVLIWVAIFQIFDAMAITYINALRGAGDTRWSAVVMSVGAWAIFIGGGWLMTRYAPGWHINGPWAMCTLYIIVAGVLLAWRWYRGPWRTIRLFEQPAAAAIVAEAPGEALTGAGAPAGAATEVIDA